MTTIWLKLRDDIDKMTSKITITSSLMGIYFYAGALAMGYWGHRKRKQLKKLIGICRKNWHDFITTYIKWQAILHFY